MKRQKVKRSLFDLIAPVYGLFYNFQKSHYRAILNKAQKNVDLSKYKSIADIGCGTGACCAVLDEEGFLVTGIDPSSKMLKIAIRKQKNRRVVFIQADGLERLPFEDKHFDISMTSFVAHGLKADERKIFYAEMSRISKHLVLICDYNQKRSLAADFIEWLEGGDYFNFILNGQQEMSESFKHTEVIDVAAQTALYACVPG